MKFSSLKSFRNFYFVTLANTFIVIGTIFLAVSFGPIVVDNVWFYLKEFRKQVYTLKPVTNGTPDSIFARLLSTRPIEMIPVNTDFSLVIERLGVNVPVVANVPVTDNPAYMVALKNGVAHASVSDLPSTIPGNVYMFAHTSLNFWQLGTYANVFNLLGKLDMGDRVHVFYKGSDYIYEVVNKEVVAGWNTYPIKRSVIEPILTLQTCDPPGTTLNRLVVTSKLIDVKN